MIDNNTSEFIITRVLDEGLPLEENIKSQFKNSETLTKLHEEVKDLNAILMDDYHSFCEDYENDIFDRTNFHCSSSVIKGKKIGLTTFTKK